MRVFLLILLFSFISMVQSRSVHACISPILETTEFVKSLLLKDRKDLEYSELRIVMAYERDKKYFNELPDACHNIFLSKEQLEINKEIRQLILKKWLLDTDLFIDGVE